MRLKPVLSSMAYVPLSYIQDVAGLLCELTVRYKDDNGDYHYIHTYDLTVDGYIGLPRAYGMSAFPHLNFVNRTATKNPMVPLRRKALAITPRNELQKQFMDDLANVCTEAGVVDYIANATTGSGKTVADLWLTANLGVPSIVLVHTERLMRQWLDRIREFFGEAWADKYVGIAQKDKCIYNGKLIVLGMLQSNSRRNYGLEYYRYFGKLIIDEVHKVGAPLMSNVLKKFPQAIRGGMTATNRSDTLQKVIDLHLGEPKVNSTQVVLTPTVYVINLHSNIPPSALRRYNERTALTDLSNNTKRNNFIANLIHSKSVNRGRNGLVLSDRIAQLISIKKRLIKLGMDKNDIGLYVGTYSTGRWYAAKGRTKLGPWKSKYHPELLKALKENEGFKPREDLVKPDDEELNRISKCCSVILATYGIFSEGIDIPRLDWGLEATPRGKVTQSVGRVLRIMQGKKTPEWVTIVDRITINERAEDMFSSLLHNRMTGYNYHNANVKVVHHEI